MSRFLLLLLPLITLVFTSCQTDKPTFTLSVHSEISEMESPRSIMPDLIGNPPRKVILARSPEFSHSNIAAYHSFPADNGNGNGVALKLDFKGTQALELVTRMRQGEILRSIVNGRGVDYVVIDRPITDGIFTIWEGVGDEVGADGTLANPGADRARRRRCSSPGRGRRSGSPPAPAPWRAAGVWRLPPCCRRARRGG